MESLDQLADLTYSMYDPQNEPDPEEIFPEREEKYIDALYDLKDMIDDCLTQTSHIKEEFKTRKLSGIESQLEKVMEDIDTLIMRGI